MPRVLWVDDEPATLLRAASEVEDYDFDFASNAATAIEKIAERIYDLVILDVMLPLGAGIERDSDEAVLRAYKDRVGIGLLELLSSGALDTPNQSFLPSRLPVVICTDYTIEVLVQDGELLNNSRVLLLPKVDLGGAPNTLVTILDRVISESRATPDMGRSEDSDDQEGDSGRLYEFPLLFARLLHDHGSSVATISLAIRHAIELLRSRLDDNYPIFTLDDVATNLQSPAGLLAKNLVGLREELASREEEQQSTLSHIAEIEDLEVVLDKHASGESLLEVLEAREITYKMTRLLDRFRGRIQRSILKILRDNLSAWEDFILLYDLYHAMLRTEEMRLQAQTLGGYLEKQETTGEQDGWFDLEEMVSDVVRTLKDFSAVRGVEIRCLKLEGGRRRPGAQSCEFYGARGSLTRALRNIVHNGIKYSYNIRGSERLPWVTVITQLVESEYSVEVESWGVPIEPEEIKGGLIFQEGYRGRHSVDQGRHGSGLGLADAYRTVQRHRGAIEVCSEPASNSKGWQGVPPNITRFKIRLPLIDHIVDLE